MKKRILFLCTGNSCRSQMAEGWMRYLHDEFFEVCSAGIESHGLNPLAVEVMLESGVDISAHNSSLLSETEQIVFDVVFTVCSHADKVCPSYPAGTSVVHVPFDDPPALAKSCLTKEEKLVFYRRVRDQIKLFVEELPLRIFHIDV
jgi:arsenate reductase (thioredoxin)